MISTFNLGREESKIHEMSVETEKSSNVSPDVVIGVFSRHRFDLLKASCFEEKHYAIKAIKQIAIRILFVLQAVFLAALLPWPFKGPAIVMTSLGAPFLAGFFFLKDSFYPSEWAESSSPTALDGIACSS